jgi:hypothetical protein
VSAGNLAEMSENDPRAMMQHVAEQKKEKEKKRG